MPSPSGMGRPAASRPAGQAAAAGDADRLGRRRLLDAIAIGQLTPGRVFTTATFIGYLLAVIPGAVVATVGILLPSFMLVGASHPFLPRLRAKATISVAIDGLNAAVVRLIGASVVVGGALVGLLVHALTV